MKLVVNIPAFNEADKIGETIGRIKQSFSADFYSSDLGKIITEKLIQVVDDGSTDNTAVKAHEAGVDLIVSYKPNRRLAYSFKRAVENSLENGADLMVNIDADGQFDPEDIPKLLTPILEGNFDMVIANRFGHIEAKNIPWIRNFLNRFAAKMVSYFLNYKTEDLTCGFRALNRETLMRLSLTNLDFTYTQETIIDAIGKNLKLKWVPIKVTYFPNRKPKITKSIVRFVGNGFKIIMRAVRDVRPMKFFGIPGLIIVLSSLVVFAIFLTFYFQNFEITPYRNYIFLSVILFLVGLQFIVFALIADMIKSNRKLTEDLMYQMKKEKYRK
ncbi:MAG: glycosyltransferase family 2 protein [Candidatus Moranbacteria bacterium]|nr:glycosyltransferase family 2 protein [Candidatus Moranbacteria bacterium]